MGGSISITVDAGMTSVTIIEWKGDPEMADTAESSFQDILHLEMLCRLLLDVKYVRMAVCAIQQLYVGPMREKSRRHVIPFSGEL